MLRHCRQQLLLVTDKLLLQLLLLLLVVVIVFPFPLGLLEDGVDYGVVDVVHLVLGLGASLHVDVEVVVSLLMTFADRAQGEGPSAPRRTAHVGSNPLVGPEK